MTILLMNLVEHVTNLVSLLGSEKPLLVSFVASIALKLRNVAKESETISIIITIS